MQVSIKSDLSKVIEDKFFQEALQGKEGQDKQSIEREIAIQKRKVGELERRLHQIVSNIASEMDSMNGKLEIDMEDFEIKKILRTVIDSVKIS